MTFDGVLGVVCEETCSVVFSPLDREDAENDGESGLCSVLRDVVDPVSIVPLDGKGVIA